MSDTAPTDTRSFGDGPPSPTPRRRVNRRERILRTAADVFATRGFDNTSLADIAATLDITPAEVLHHFGSKTELLTAVLELRDNDDPAPQGGDMLDHLVTTAARNSGRPGTTRLYAVLSAESATAGHPAGSGSVSGARCCAKRWRRPFSTGSARGTTTRRPAPAPVDTPRPAQRPPPSWPPWTASRCSGSWTRIRWTWQR